MRISQESDRSILVISTEINNARIIIDILKQKYKVFHIQDVIAFSEFIDFLSPDLILFEYNRADRNSYIIWQQLNNSCLINNIPIIFLSSGDHILDRASIYEMGGVDYILYPYQQQEILSKVEHQLIIQLATDEVDFLEQILELKVQERTAKLQKQITKLKLEIEKEKTTQKQLVYNALHDSLTGLPNRTLLKSKIDNAIQRTKRNPDYLFALLFIDVDRFKIINDSLGHLIGDRLLIAIAQLLSKQVRDIDTVARLGGDEFVILLDGIQQAIDATYTCDRLLAKLEKPIFIGDWTISTSISIGIAFSSHFYQNSSQILHDADIAMYSAKKTNKANYAIFDRAFAGSKVC